MTRFFAPVMSNDTLKTKKRLSTLATSLDELETGLTALLSQPLPDLIHGLDTIQQAKLQVVIPYLVYDLVFGPWCILVSLLVTLPTNTALSSLPQDQRPGPKNASGGRRARAFPFLSHQDTAHILIMVSGQSTTVL